MRTPEIVSIIDDIISKYSSTTMSEEVINSFFNDLHNVLGLSFHPDDDFDTYYDENGPLFLQPEVDALDAIMYKAFKYCEKHGLDIYSIGMKTHPLRHLFGTDAIEETQEYDNKDMGEDEISKFINQAQDWLETVLEPISNQLIERTSENYDLDSETNGTSGNIVASAWIEFETTPEVLEDIEINYNSYYENFVDFAKNRNIPGDNIDITTSNNTVNFVIEKTFFN